ncbi:bifunctional 2-polyprenyl-6-hydroxyphenol methylase/3-demethylubiquinol 3-O-methyltransferase UbiG [Devosia sp.]|uniref:class I SAM-dependent methyltransferase n=1 Tax=Devosia sp. TaxID=1871048 RepID=UPI001B18065A|nr:50S ribosomal protein L11 methyltransferase [Devosia sp.]MBO9591149.1 50S ribosomal protein L11 methyltransferase [Devosia sp.]
MKPLAASFRDPSGHIYSSDGRILRVVTPTGLDYFSRSHGLLRQMVAEGRLVDFSEVNAEGLDFEDNIGVVLEHPRLDLLSMPYEWSFSLLKAAALFHLDFHMDLLEQGFTLSDASAYNVQFVGVRPIFIDHLSIRPYSEGEFWTGHRQFCEQFLNPLLLRSYFDIAHNAWYRGNLEGIPLSDFSRLLPWHRRLSWRVLSNIVLPAHFQKRTQSERDVPVDLSSRSLPKAGLLAMLRQLRAWIGSLNPANQTATTWANYAATATYDSEEMAAKKRFVKKFIGEADGGTVIDLGCNTGDYSVAALEAGASSVVGFDFDQQTLDIAYQRALTSGLNFLPLFLDARNPSPAQGWREAERDAFSTRFKADTVLALAFEHHLAIAHNVPIDQVVHWITKLAPRAIIEFVPKSDPTVQKMLALREDIFASYSEDAFVAALNQVGSIVGREVVSATGRTIYALQAR